MKTVNPASVTATFVSAILSLILPASAMSTEEAVRSHRDAAVVRIDRRTRSILASKEEGPRFDRSPRSER
jgi:hypothetical protein